MRPGLMLMFNGYCLHKVYILLSPCDFLGFYQSNVYSTSSLVSMSSISMFGFSQMGTCRNLKCLGKFCTDPMKWNKH